MTTPKRIQRKRTKGWRMPDGAKYVGRPSAWGNPYWLKDCGRSEWVVMSPSLEMPWTRGTKVEAAQAAVDVFRKVLVMGLWSEQLVRDELAGLHLACWCPLDQPCHADLLLKIANSPDDRRARETSGEAA